MTDFDSWLSTEYKDVLIDDDTYRVAEWMFCSPFPISNASIAAFIDKRLLEVLELTGND